MNVQRGDILLWHQNRYTENFFLKTINTLIGGFQDRSYIGDYVHAALVIDPFTIHCVEMLPQGATYSGLTIDDFIESDIEYWGLKDPVDKKTIDRACNTALYQVSKKTPYDFIALTGLFYTPAHHALYCTRLVSMCYPALWEKFKNDKLISPNELIASGLIYKKGSLSRDQLPDYWAAEPAPDNI